MGGSGHSSTASHALSRVYIRSVRRDEIEVIDRRKWFIDLVPQMLDQKERELGKHTIKWGEGVWLVPHTTSPLRGDMELSEL